MVTSIGASGPSSKKASKCVRCLNSAGFNSDDAWNRLARTSLSWPTRIAFDCCCCCSKDPNNYIFCSELVSNIFKDLGLINKNVKSYNVLPPDFVKKNDKETYDEDREIPILLSDPLKIII